jgi:hypothetical protein
MVAAPSEKVIVIQPASAPASASWEGAISAINSGAYAVLVTLAIVYLFGRKAVGRALEKHFGLLETLQKTQERNADSLSDMAESQKEIRVSLINLGKRVYTQSYGFMASHQQDDLDDDA